MIFPQQQPPRQPSFESTATPQPPSAMATPPVVSPTVPATKVAQAPQQPPIDQQALQNLFRQLMSISGQADILSGRGVPMENMQASTMPSYYLPNPKASNLLPAALKFANLHLATQYDPDNESLRKKMDDSWVEYATLRDSLGGLPPKQEEEIWDVALKNRRVDATMLSNLMKKDTAAEKTAAWKTINANNLDFRRDELAAKKEIANILAKNRKEIAGLSARSRQYGYDRQYQSKVISSGTAQQKLALAAESMRSRDRYWQGLLALRASGIDLLKNKQAYQQFQDKKRMALFYASLMRQASNTAMYGAANAVEKDLADKFWDNSEAFMDQLELLDTEMNQIELDYQDQQSQQTSPWKYTYPTTNVYNITPPAGGGGTTTPSGTPNAATQELLFGKRKK